MDELHVAQIGPVLDLEEIEFLSSQNLLEFDLVLIDLKHVVEACKEQNWDKISKRIEDLREFVKKKNMPLVFFCNSEGELRPWNALKTTIFEVEGLEVNTIKSMGRKIDHRADNIFTDFLKAYADTFEYEVCFTAYPGVSIGNPKSQPYSVGFYTKDYVFLPALGEEFNHWEKEFVKDLYEACIEVRKGDGTNIELPEWTKKFHLPGEQEELKVLNDLDKRIQKLEALKKDSEMRLSAFKPMKQLWTASGTSLENVAKEVFKELGFSIGETEHNRTDILMNWNGRTVVVEVKGQNKSSGEGQSAQLEKWVAHHKVELELDPKGILLVNTFREKPINQRSEVSFPDQMMKYAKRNEHCLMTTLQLCSLLLYVRENPEEKEEMIRQLLSTVGRYDRFEKWDEIITADIAVVKKMAKKNKV